MAGPGKIPAGGGTLYLVGTPIGNLEDMTLRGLRTLEEVDLIACEDTRRTKKLLSHFNIHTPVTSYHQHSQPGKVEELLARVRSGQKVAVVSDAGMPAISDPGRDLVARAVSEGLYLAVIPGPSALTAALAVSGLAPQPFTFLGFWPRTNKERRRLLEELAHLYWTAVFYEAPHRLVETLKDISQRWPSRPVVVAREMTKVFEEVVRGSAQEVYRHFAEHEPRGEITVLVGGADAPRARVPAEVGAEAGIGSPAEVLDLAEVPGPAGAPNPAEGPLEARVPAQAGLSPQSPGPGQPETSQSLTTASALALALEEARALVRSGRSAAQAAKASAQRYDLPRRTIYRLLVEETPAQDGSEEG